MLLQKVRLGHVDQGFGVEIAARRQIGKVNAFSKSETHDQGFACLVDGRQWLFDLTPMPIARDLFQPVLRLLVPGRSESTTATMRAGTNP